MELANLINLVPMLVFKVTIAFYLARLLITGLNSILVGLLMAILRRMV